MASYGDAQVLLGVRVLGRYLLGLQKGKESDKRYLWQDN